MKYDGMYGEGAYGAQYDHGTTAYGEPAYDSEPYDEHFDG